MRRVLIVDDNADAAVALARLIELGGYETRVATSGTSAMQAFHDFQPNVVLLDLGMPDVDGFEICRQIRSLPEAAGVLIVVVSGYLQDDVRAQALAAGANDYLTKPADAAQVLSLVERHSGK